MSETTKRIDNFFEERIKNSETLLARCAWADVRDKIATHLHQEVLKGKIEELEVAKDKIALSSYHSGRSVDLSWVQHRINEIKAELGKVGAE